MSLGVTTKQKCIVDSPKRRQSENITTENHQFTKEGSKRGRKNKKTTEQPENNKMV